MSARVPRPYLFGEVLFDRFPDGSVVLGGAPFNVARHLHGLGLAPRLVTRVGADPLGDAVVAACTDSAMDAAELQRDPARPTGTVDVALDNGEPTFAINDNVAWDAIAVPATDGPPGALLYHGSLALRHAANRATLAMLRGHLAAPVFLDVNLRAPWWSRERVAGLLDRARWVKLNAGELAALAGVGDEDAAVARLRAGRALDLVVVTRGEAGACAYPRDGAAVAVRPDASVPVIDTVGAGDAFAAVLILGLLHGWPLAQTLERAQAFAGKIVGQRGAVPADPTFHRPFATAWSTG